LRIRPETIYVKASDNIETMLKIVERLMDKGLAYEKLHSVYFNISRFNDYGMLTKVDLDKTRPMRSVDLDDYEKNSPADFALLKRSSLAELKRGIYYKTIWGNVRPSWHLECASISQKYFGPSYDIHVSGTDETFPHCENILAIHKAYAGSNGPNYWINTEMVTVHGRKMSRSFNNDLPLSRLKQKGFSGYDVRFFLLEVHYRKPVNYSEEALKNAKNTVRKLHTLIQRLHAVKSVHAGGSSETQQLLYDLKHDFEGALDDDLNISGALVALFSFVRKINVLLSRNQIHQEDAQKILTTLKNIDAVLGIMDFELKTVQSEINELLVKREEARLARNWAEADVCRAKLAERGVEVLDTPQGVIWRYK